MDSDLSKALKSIKYNINQYKGFVYDYKNAHDKELKRGLEQLNISNYLLSNDLTAKKRIQETVFPEGVIIDVKNRAYLTKKVNLVFDISRVIKDF